MSVLHSILCLHAYLYVSTHHVSLEIHVMHHSCIEKERGKL